MHRSAAGDCYDTPYSMTGALLDHMEIPRGADILEPAAGNGAIVDVLSKRHKNITAYDIDPQAVGAQRDFFDEKTSYDYIITNPPYRQADAFVKHGKGLMGVQMALLLRTNFLSGQKRFRDGGIYDELSDILIFTRMSDLRAPLREDGKYPTAGIVYAWMIWTKYFTGAPEVSWIDNGEYVLKKGE